MYILKILEQFLIFIVVIVEKMNQKEKELMTETRNMIIEYGTAVIETEMLRGKHLAKNETLISKGFLKTERLTDGTGTDESTTEIKIR